MEKQSYALVKSLNHFKSYVGYSRIVSFTPHPTAKDILSQHDCLGTSGKWVSKIQECDLEIKPTKIIKGQVLANLITKCNEEEIGLKDEHCNMVSVVTHVLEKQDWYKDMVFYLRHLTSPSHLPEHKRISLRLKASNYSFIDQGYQGMGWRSPDGVIPRCVDSEEVENLKTEFH